jgi:hypothetical protein
MYHCQNPPLLYQLTTNRSTKTQIPHKYRVHSMIPLHCFSGFTQISSLADIFWHTTLPKLKLTLTSLCCSYNAPVFPVSSLPLVHLNRSKPNQFYKISPSHQGHSLPHWNWNNTNYTLCPIRILQIYNITFEYTLICSNKNHNSISIQWPMFPSSPPFIKQYCQILASSPCHRFVSLTRFNE